MYSSSNNTFVLELSPHFNQYSKINEQLYIEALLNSLIDHFGNSFTLDIYPKHQYINDYIPTNIYENIDVCRVTFLLVFTFKNNTYTIYDFITRCYDFKDELSEFINYFISIGFFTDRYKNDIDTYNKIKYKLVVKNSDYIEKKIIKNNKSEEF